MIFRVKTTIVVKTSSYFSSKIETFILSIAIILNIEYTLAVFIYIILGQAILNMNTRKAKYGAFTGQTNYKREREKEMEREVKTAPVVSIHSRM